MPACGACIWRDQTRGLPPDAVGKLRRMLTFLQDMETVDELRTLPHWKAHRLTWRPRGHLGASCHAQLAADVSDRRRTTGGGER